MPKECAYRVLTLRYFPSLPTEEFVNVGVALVCPETGWWDLRIAPEVRNIEKVFPTAQPRALRALLTQVEERVSQFAADGRVAQMDPESAMKRAVGDLVGSLRWGDNPLEGITSAPDAEIDYWFDILVKVRRTVTTASIANSSLRSEASAAGTMQKVLRDRGIWSKLRAVTVRSIIDHKFKHTYQNGRLHIFEPIVLDQSARKVVSTAEQWRGRIDSLSDQNNNLSFVPFISLPADPKLAEVASAAIKVIASSKSADVHPFTTEQAEEFGEYVEHIAKH